MKDNVDYDISAREVHVVARADFESLDEYLDGDAWVRYQLLSHIHVINARYYQLASHSVRSMRNVRAIFRRASFCTTARRAHA